MIATFFSGLIVLTLIFGAYAIDFCAEWNRERRRTLRSREVSRPTPARVTRSLPRSGSPTQASRVALGRGARHSSSRSASRSGSPIRRTGPWL